MRKGRTGWISATRFRPSSIRRTAGSDYRSEGALFSLEAPLPERLAAVPEVGLAFQEASPVPLGGAVRAGRSTSRIAVAGSAIRYCYGGGNGLFTRAVGCSRRLRERRIPKRDEVFRVADKLRAAGKRPSYRLVTEALPRGGSPKTALKHLEAWRDERAYKPKLEAKGLPEPQQERPVAFAEGIWKAAQEQAATVFRREREAAEETRHAEAEDRECLAGQLEAAQAEATGLRALSEAARSQADHLRVRLDKVENQLARFRAEEFWDRADAGDLRDAALVRHDERGGDPARAEGAYRSGGGAPQGGAVGDDAAQEDGRPRDARAVFRGPPRRAVRPPDRLGVGTTAPEIGAAVVQPAVVRVHRRHVGAGAMTIGHEMLMSWPPRGGPLLHSEQTSQPAAMSEKGQKFAHFLCC